MSVSLYVRASSPHRDLRDVAPLADALGVFGVGGAVTPLGGGGGEGLGVRVVGAGVDGEEGPDAGAAVHLDFEGFLAVLGREDFDFAAAEAEGDFRDEVGGIDVGGIRADDACGIDAVSRARNIDPEGLEYAGHWLLSGRS